jgi:hypothetical protein
MGFWKAREVDVQDLGEGFLEVLADAEEAVQAFKFRRDLIVFTDRRLIFVDKQGLTGKKADYHSVPYRAITHFSVESPGTFDADADLKIWVSGSDKPIEKDLSTNVDIKLLLRTMAEHIL